MSQTQDVLSLLDAAALLKLVKEGRGCAERHQRALQAATPEKLPSLTAVDAAVDAAASTAEANDIGDSSGRQSAVAATIGPVMGGVHNSSGAGGSGDDGGLLEAAARAFLGLMCDGRLMPTDWLNHVRTYCSDWTGASCCSAQSLHVCPPFTVQAVQPQTPTPPTIPTPPPHPGRT